LAIHFLLIHWQTAKNQIITRHFNSGIEIPSYNNNTPMGFSPDIFLTLRPRFGSSQKNKEEKVLTNKVRAQNFFV